ncbi:M48 family peptidase [Prosthecochloris sp. ZM_2]|uniref:M48 family metallopeptidase n=1 Tax=Prosthecochloris sp. ZM_2 TaxID=2045206 RepID=UPI000DF7CCFB|nr:M48 family metallopeptidase [Prosthecochloris sp. ZM_2]RNA64874.1 M48 family peptidase [Prosthecochloris sp. ZM_2]
MLHDRRPSLRKRLTTACTALCISAVLGSCTTVPITGRSQLNLVPSSTMMSLSTQQYSSFLRESRLSTDQAETARLHRVGRRLRDAVETYFRQQGLASQLRGYSWQFNLVDDDTPNAWCMPGGKIVVYSGILPYTRDDAGLAVVLAHEIAHAVAEHGNERMTQSLLTRMGGVALNAALGSKPEKTRALWMSAFGIGSQLAVVLPYSRLQEYEADRLGLIFMALAGYRPSEAISFWQRMTEQQNSPAPPEFLSTHPSDQARIQRIRQTIPEAMRYYRPQ